MSGLTTPMRRLIESYSAGAVATINADGTPAVSPKATFVVIDETCIAFGNIRSPGTVANLRARPAVQVSFLDVLTRRAVRVTGHATVVEKDSAQGRQLLPAFEQNWAEYVDRMQNFVCIAVSHAELILSPAYDIGHTAEELRRVNLERLSELV